MSIPSRSYRDKQQYSKVRRVNTLRKVWLCDWMDFPHLDIFMLIPYTAESRVLTQLNTE